MRKSKAQREAEKIFAEFRDEDLLRRTERWMRRIARRVLRGPPKETASWSDAASKEDKGTADPNRPETCRQLLPMTMPEAVAFARDVYWQMMESPSGRACFEENMKLMAVDPEAAAMAIYIEGGAHSLLTIQYGPAKEVASEY